MTSLSDATLSLSSVIIFYHGAIKSFDRFGNIFYQVPLCNVIAESVIIFYNGAIIVVDICTRME